MEIPREIQEAFIPRDVRANKYTVGTVTIVGGSDRYANAPVIAGLGARAAGAGLVQLVVPKVSRFAAGPLLPEAMMTELSADCELPRADVTVIGMGLGLDPQREDFVLRLLSGARGRFVVDADALTFLAHDFARKGGFASVEGRELVLTPHEGEAARLLGTTKEAIAADRHKAAREIAARYGATVVLKGHRSLVVSADGGEIYENTSGNPMMAMGGMGDLLSGVIAARWAYLKKDVFRAVASSVWLHGLASDVLVAEGGDPSIIKTAEKLGALRVRLDFGKGNVI